mmetsp:Transcript_43509/g.128755  ORF Transcript_43509/g.128755 Transcript_43509/m.128755 type:complete len:296 (-) Transcript_43509:57-944(-)
MGGGGDGAKDEDLGDVYELIGVEQDATDKEITTAYRKASLKCHPDRNPDDPEAPAKFDRLTRAKDLLLDPARRAGLDREKKAAFDREQRYAQEDSKRRKLREDLENREGRFASATVKVDPKEEAKKKMVASDFAARIKVREQQRAEQAAEVAAEAAELRRGGDGGTLRVVWRKADPPTGFQEAIKEALKDFKIDKIEVMDTEATVEFPSREAALQAVLQCRGKRHQLPFRVELAAAPAAAPGGAKPERAAESEKKVRKPVASKPPQASRTGSFDDWEANMLESLMGMANAQKKAK